MSLFLRRCRGRTAAALAFALATILLVPPAANAAPPITCQTNQYGVAGMEMTSTGAQQTDIHGTRADVYVGTALYCNRVSSLIINSKATTPNDQVFVEFGWVLGWSNCNQTYYSTPRLFIWWSNYNDGNSMHCKILGYPGATDTFHELSVGDLNVDSKWNGRLDGVVIPSAFIDSNFATGRVITNAERSNSSDTEFAEFSNTEEYVNSWSSTDNLRLVTDRDPDFHLVRLSGDHVQVVSD